SSQTPAAGDETQANTSDDPARAQPPPEHAERLAVIDDAAVEIETDTAVRESLQAEYRSLPEISDEPTELQRDSIKSELTNCEKHLAEALEKRIALIDDAIHGLEAILPGFTPGPPPAQIASSPANEGESGGGPYTVQSELYRLQTEKQKNEA